MKRALPLALLIALSTPACGSIELVYPVEGPDAGADAAPDAEPPPEEAGPPPPPMLGPSLALDDLHIATLKEAFHAFALLGGLVNEQFKTNIQNGTLLVGLELRELDDPSGQNDDAMTVAMIGLSDSDGDPSDNFDPNTPETFAPAPLSFAMGDNPTVLFSQASVKDGKLHAESVGLLSVPGLPIPFANPVLEGTLMASAENDFVKTLENGRLTGAVPASLLSLVPNITMGTCNGQTLLDVIATGCGVFALQPEVDLDGDGLEKLFDDENADADAGSGKDGQIDRCVDGDGTEILGTDCASDPRIADAYRLVFALHGVRAFVLAP
ncbi:MAG: hypothetical protein L6Q76_26800 [Polyangiaceae bacterium]|nr:hypothetical protein [Polyangiaceae bacterium]